MADNVKIVGAVANISFVAGGLIKLNILTELNGFSQLVLLQNDAAQVDYFIDGELIATRGELLQRLYNTNLGIVAHGDPCTRADFFTRK